ncbi:amino acid--tRNA ligase-related protein [Streptomyces reticuliscabiei]|uniref:amino acid--tRNA ligase-related protein n=1 Tax=Streptomyces reticuliscabiei TaxID=146821 RepID=UPI000A3875B2|nr:amino acid--tRNA ligase-related protein [Streptomyces reticuliscabiei]
MLDPLSLKSDVLFHLRDTLRAQGFREAITPVARRADLGPGRRAPVDLAGGRFLRAMIGPALRMNLEYHTRVFEIGPCFRPEEPDRLHAAEFTMLDLYAAHEEYAFLLDLAKQLVAAHLPYTPVQISVGDYIRDVFGIDLRREPVGDLPRQMADRLGLDVDTPFKDTLGQFVERELETQSVNAAVFLVDYPLGGDEPCARLTPGTVAQLNRFELIVDGIEVIHGYEDEPDGAAFTQRAKEVDLYDEEQRLAQEAIDGGRVPAASVGLGIGVERLCMAASGVKDISRFQQSPMY